MVLVETEPLRPLFYSMLAFDVIELDNKPVASKSDISEEGLDIRLSSPATELLSSSVELGQFRILLKGLSPSLPDLLNSAVTL